jgi:O-antigen/teichoic acid export membrane protein
MAGRAGSPHLGDDVVGEPAELGELGLQRLGVRAVGTLCYLLAMVLGQGAMALSRHRDQLLSWLAGVAVLTVITTAPGEVTMRVVTAYAAGCATVAVVLAVVPVRHSAVTRRHARRRAPAWPTANQ